jgi:hypothetical protein
MPFLQVGMHILPKEGKQLQHMLLEENISTLLSIALVSIRLFVGEGYAMPSLACLLPNELCTKQEQIPLNVTAKNRWI